MQPPIPAGRPGQVSLRDVSFKLPSALMHCNKTTKKHHHTAGFYTKLVRTAVNSLPGDHCASGHKAESEEDVGGYRDVGRHTGVIPLSTCWPLVEQVFRHLADQVCSLLRCLSASSCRLLSALYPRHLALNHRYGGSTPIFKFKVSHGLYQVSCQVYCPRAQYKVQPSAIERF